MFEFFLSTYFSEFARSREGAQKSRLPTFESIPPRLKILPRDRVKFQEHVTKHTLPRLLFVLAKGTKGVFRHFG